MWNKHFLQLPLHCPCWFFFSSFCTYYFLVFFLLPVLYVTYIQKHLWTWCVQCCPFLMDFLITITSDAIKFPSPLPTCIRASSSSLRISGSGSLVLSSGKYWRSRGRLSFSSSVKVSGPARGSSSLPATSMSSPRSHAWLAAKEEWMKMHFFLQSYLTLLSKQVRDSQENENLIKLN